MESSDVKRLKDLKEESSRLKKMYADLPMDNWILKDLFTKKRLGPATKKQLITATVEEYGISVSRACKIITFPVRSLIIPVRKTIRSSWQRCRNWLLNIRPMASESSLLI